MNLEYIYSALMSYFLGAIPSAYIVVKLFTGKNVLTEGSGNVGAHNSMDVSGKKSIGILVLVLDVLKAVAAVWLSREFFRNDDTVMGIAAVGVVVGHNFNVFLKFRGGRGLASAAGAAFVINPFVNIAWILMFLIGYNVIRKDVHVGAIFATLLTPFIIWRAPDYVLLNLMLWENFDIEIYKNLCYAVLFVIMMRHIDPLVNLIRNWNKE